MRRLYSFYETPRSFIKTLPGSGIRCAEKMVSRTLAFFLNRKNNLRHSRVLVRKCWFAACFSLIPISSGGILQDGGGFQGEDWRETEGIFEKVGAAVKRGGALWKIRKRVWKIMAFFWKMTGIFFEKRRCLGK